MTTILAAQAEETRTKGEALIKQADRLLCESWNERMWADGEPIDPSPTVDQSIKATSRGDLAYGSGIVPVPLQLGDQSLLPPEMDFALTICRSAIARCFSTTCRSTGSRQEL